MFLSEAPPPSRSLSKAAAVVPAAGDYLDAAEPCNPVHVPESEREDEDDAEFDPSFFPIHEV